MSYVPVIKRIRAEYLEMPGLRLTLPQAQRLFGLEPMLCQTVFDSLVDERFLCVTVRGLYARTTDAVSRLRRSPADLGAGECDVAAP